MKTTANKLTYAAAAFLLLGGCAAAWSYRDAFVQWLKPSDQAPTILVSGNIEAHQSVLGFKTVQSSIVEMPFNEGEWSRPGR
jgi:HlyD family secretion protein